MTPPYSTLAVANYFVQKGHDESLPVDPMKLQKLIYFAHGWHLAVTGEPLIDETVEAWQYGPVIPTVYHTFKRYGRYPITAPGMDFDGESFYCPALPAAAEEESLAVLDRVWETYGRRFTGIQLSNLSHEAGSPWQITWDRAQQAGKLRGTDIDDRLIEDFFRAQGVENRQEGLLPQAAALPADGAASRG